MTPNNFDREHSFAIPSRRQFLVTAVLALTAPLLTRFALGMETGAGQPSAGAEPHAANLANRKLGSLEVSALGLGCISMAGTYSRIPDRQEIIASSGALKAKIQVVK